MLLLLLVRTNPELLLRPVTICRNENERCLIEASINSVRISVKVSTCSAEVVQGGRQPRIEIACAITMLR